MNTLHCEESTSQITMVRKEDSETAWTDASGVLFSNDRKKLLRCPVKLHKYAVPQGTEIICDRAFNHCNSLKHIIIPDSVSHIGICAFKDCRNLRSIALPASVEDLGLRSFQDCKSLKTIRVDKSNKNFISVDGVLFDKDMKRLIRFPSAKRMKRFSVPSSVDEIGDGAFSGCEHLKSVTLATSTIISAYAFHSCRSLKTIVMPPKAQHIGVRAFDGCEALEYLQIPESVMQIGESAFSWCHSLVSIDVNDANPHYTSVDGILFDKDMTTLIRFPGKKDAKEYAIPSTVTSIANIAFNDCRMLEKIEIPSSVETIGNWAFDGCRSLNDIKIPTSVKTIGNGIFYGCKTLKNISIPDSIHYIEEFMFCECESLERISMPSSVTGIGANAFCGCGSLLATSIPASVTSIGAKAFFNCPMLRSIDMPQTVNSIGADAFGECRSLESITLPQMNAVEDRQFYNCRCLRSIIVPPTASSIGEEAFSGCSSLRSVTLPSSVTAIGKGVFDRCRSLQNIIIPKGRKAAFALMMDKKYRRRLQEEGEHQKYGDEELKSAKVSEDDIAEAWVDDFEVKYSRSRKRLLQGNWKLEKYIVREGTLMICDWAFSDCKSLKAVKIANSVTVIGECAFHGCEALNSIIIPPTVTKIGWDAFSGCSALKSIIVIKGSKERYGNMINTEQSRLLVEEAKLPDWY